MSINLDRGEFLKTSVAAAAATGSPAPVPAAPPAFPILERHQYDYEGVMQIVRAKHAHKQCFLSNPDLAVNGVAGVYVKVSNAWNAYTFSFGPDAQPARLAVVLVLISRPVVFALNDAMWRKYRIGSVLRLTDRYGRVAASNFTYRSWWNESASAPPSDPRSRYHDYTAQALLARGAGIFVCHNALFAVAGTFAAASGVPHATVLEDFAENLLPGFLIVPAGAAAIQLLQEHGWRLYPITD